MFSSEVTEDNQDTENTKVTLIDLLKKCPDISTLIFSTNILILRQTSKTIYDMLKNANIRIAIKNKEDYEFSNQEELSYKLNSLNTWCYVYKLCLLHCKLRADGARAIADVLRVNSTLWELNLYYNHVGADGAREIAEALCVNSTLQELYLYGNDVRTNGNMAFASMLRVNSTLQKLSLWDNDIGVRGDEERALRESWGNRKGTLDI